MNIQWLGHAAFKLVESTGTIIITDPFEKKDIGYDMLVSNPNIVTKSNCSASTPNSVSGDPLVIHAEGIYEVDGVHILCVGDNDTVNENGDYNNLIFKFRILLVPVGGGDCITADMASEYVELLMPDVVVPMSFKTRDTILDLDKVDLFLRQFEDYEIIYTNSPVEFDRTEFDGETTKIIVFNK